MPDTKEDMKEEAIVDTPNGDSRKDDSVKDLGAEATCAPGCGCSAGGSGGRARWITGIIILIVAGGLVARAMIKDNAASNAGGCGPASAGCGPSGCK